MDYPDFSQQWETNPQEITISGTALSSCDVGDEVMLIEKLRDANNGLYFVICTLLNISGERLASYFSLANRMLDESIKTTMEVGPELADDELYMESCAVIAYAATSAFEDIQHAMYEVEQTAEVDDPNPSWDLLAKQAIEGYGGASAACAAVALGMVDLATVLIRAKHYQYAWCAVTGSLSLTLLATGLLMSEERQNLKFSMDGKQGAAKRHKKTNDLKEWTISEYQNGEWGSVNSAAYDLREKVLKHSRLLGVNLAPSNAQRTIAGWISRANKNA